MGLNYWQEQTISNSTAIDVLGVNISANASSIATLEGQMTTANSSISANTTAISTLDASLAAITQQVTVTEATNVFTCDLSLGNSFVCAITNTDAKTIAFTNIPAGITFATPIVVKIVCTAAAVVNTYPDGVVWQDGQAPVYVDAKTFYLYFMRIAAGWHSGYAGAWS